MSNPVRILFASSEVTPFARVSETADLIRNLPEYLQEQGQFESRIMMPRYGIISERRNRLHEVIRLSGAKIPVGEDHDTLKVKVASIPGVRLQVYFMDSVKYFKRKGIYQDRKQETLFVDAPQRALFFGRAVLETARNLGWSPDLIHAHGWMSVLLPMLIRTEYASDPLFKDTRVVYSSDGIDLADAFTKDLAATLDLPTDTRGDVEKVGDLGPAFSDLTLYTNGKPAPSPDAIHLEGTSEEVYVQTTALYSDLLNLADVPA